MIESAQIVLAISVALVGITIHLVGRVWSPRRLFFVHVGRELGPEDRARSRRVLWVNGLVTAVGVTAALLSRGSSGLGSVAALSCVLPSIWLLGELVLLVHGLPAERVPGRFVVPLGEQPSATSYVSIPLELFNLLVMVACASLFAHWLGRLPERVPMQWGYDGSVSRWGNPAELWSLLGIQLFDTAILWVVVWALARERWALAPDHAERSAQLGRQRRALIVRMTEWIIVGTNLGIGVSWLALAQPNAGQRGTWLVVSVSIMALCVVLPLAVYVRRILRVQEKLRELSGTDVLGTASAGWRLKGLLYFAPDDPALFVPKRIGIGQTLNMARPAAWLFLVGVIVVPLAIAWLATAL